MDWVAVKSGWIYERKRSGAVFGTKRWEPRWIVIYSEPVPALGIYEQRSDATPPYAPLRHLDLCADRTAVVSAAEEKRQTLLGAIFRRSKQNGGPVPGGEGGQRPSSATDGSGGALQSRRTSVTDMTTVNGEYVSEKECVFSVCIERVKMRFAAKTRQDRDEWLAAFASVLTASQAPHTSSSAALCDAGGQGEPVSASSVADGGALGRLTISEGAARGPFQGRRQRGAAAATPQGGVDAICCGGVVVLEGRTVARLKCNLPGNPLVSSNSNGHIGGPLHHGGGGSANGGSSSDSITGDIRESQSEMGKRRGGEANSASSSFPFYLEGGSAAGAKSATHEFDLISKRYQQAVADRLTCKSERDCMRLEMQMHKAVGAFHDAVCQRLRVIIDGYHKLDGSQGGAHQSSAAVMESVFEDGPLRILFIADYSSRDEQVISGAYAWIRQEMNAMRWVNSVQRPSDFTPLSSQDRQDPLVVFHQPLCTVCEYKGFRALAMLAIPLGNDQASGGQPPAVAGPAARAGGAQLSTLVTEAASGVVDDAVLGSLNDLSALMNLARPYAYRLADGRTVHLSLSPTLQVYRISTPPQSLPAGGGRPKLQAGGPLHGAVAEAGAAQGPYVKTVDGLYITNMHDIVPAYPASDELRGIFYFRPEFIQRSLKSPAAVGELQAEGKGAILALLRDVHLPRFIDLLEGLSLIPISGSEWRTLMHSAGLNMALLGAIAKETHLPHVRDGAVIEMVARSVKHILRSRIRAAIVHFKSVQALRVEDELCAIVLETVNGAIHHPLGQAGGALASAAGGGGSQGWLQAICDGVEDRFGYRLEGDVVRHLPRNALLLAIQEHAGLVLKDSAYAAPHRAGPIDSGDFGGFSCQLGDNGMGPFGGSAAARMGEGGSHGSSGDGEGLLGVPFASIMLSSGAINLWSSVGGRGAAAAALTQRAQEHIAAGRWEEALQTADLATAICPHPHPEHIRIMLTIASIRTLGPASTVGFRAPAVSEKMLLLASSGNVGPSATLSAAFGGGHGGATAAGGDPHHHQGPLLSPTAQPVLDELRRSKTAILSRIERHFGTLHHPIGIDARSSLAFLFDRVEGGAKDAIEMRREALASANKVLGRSHSHTQLLAVRLADFYMRYRNYDEALCGYEDALKQANCKERLAWRAAVYNSSARAWQAKGAYESALECVTKCHALLASHIYAQDKQRRPPRRSGDQASGEAREAATEAPLEALIVDGADCALFDYESFDEIIEETLLLMAEYSQLMYSQTDGGFINVTLASDFFTQPLVSGAHGEGTLVRPTGLPASATLVQGEELLLAGPVAGHLETAVECYEELFMRLRSKKDLDEADGQRLLILSQRIVLLTLRLATPIQTPVVRAAVRRRLFQRPAAPASGAASSPASHQRRPSVVIGGGGAGDAVGDLLIRMISASATPAQLTRAVLANVESVQTLADGQQDLDRLLDLVDAPTSSPAGASAT